MNLSIVLVIISLAAYGTAYFFDKTDPEQIKLAEECASENNFDKEHLDKLVRGGKPDKSVFKTQEFKCFIKCTALKNELVTEDGDPILDNIKEKLSLDDSSPAIEALKKCQEESTETESCAKVAEINYCVMKAMRE